MRMSISERATAKRPQRAERPKPVYIARAKVGLKSTLRFYENLHNLMVRDDLIKARTT